MKYKCGCEDKGREFAFCSKHALSTQKKAIDNEWREKYQESAWEDYKNALVKGLSLVFA